MNNRSNTQVWVRDQLFRGMLVAAATFVPAMGCRPAAPNSDAAEVQRSALPAAAAAANPVQDARVYAKPPAAELATKLTKIQRYVTQESGTEPPFRNAYWDNHEAGLYVDIASGEPLFGSTDKFDSGTGWPSFVRPIVASHIVEKVDGALGMERVEVRSKFGDSHLGHVFDDGPKPTGKRYCINSASLRFIPLEQMEAEGYGAYLRAVGGPKASIAPATSNSCAKPKEGERPGCAPSVELAILAGDSAMLQTLQAAPGVLEAEAGTVAGEGAVRVVFDPLKTSYSAILETWTAKRAAGARVFNASPEQKRIAEAFRVRTGKSVALVDGVSVSFANAASARPM